MTDTGANFEQSLTMLLARLHKHEWATPLQILEQKFRQIPDPDYSFGIEILNLLQQLADALALDADLPLAQLAAIRLPALECWTYRFYREEFGGRVYLDPLTTAASDFFSGMCVVQSSSPFPARDIIQRWAREQLR